MNPTEVTEITKQLYFNITNIFYVHKYLISLYNTDDVDSLREIDKSFKSEFQKW